MAINAFTVVSEFKFDVAGAILGVDKLEGKVDSLNSTVQNALGSVRALGVGFIANFTGASAGILGVLGNAIGMSDKFTQSQLSFVQIIDSNVAHLSGTIGSINEQMMSSRKIMGDIAKDARTFGLPADELMQMTKTLSAMLIPKGLAGDDFSSARKMSRNLLKSAPNLGIDPSLVQGQLLRAIEGSASMGDTLFRRLVTEAPEPFQQAGIKDAKGFNALKAAQRFNILNDSLSKFANNSKILEMRANTLSGVMQSASDLFRSFNSVLRPLGDVLMPLIVEVFQMFIKFVDKQGREMVEAMARFIKPMIDSPREMLLNMMTLDGLAGDIAASAGIVSLIITLTHFQEIMHALSTVPYLSKIVKPLQGVFDFIMRIPFVGGALKNLMSIFKVGPISTFGGVLKAVMLTVGRMAGLFSILLIPIIGLSRALDRGKLSALEWLGNNMASIIDMFTSLKRSFSIFIAPIMDMITGFEELFSIFTEGTFFLDLFKDGLKLVTDIIGTLSDKFLELYAAFRGIIAGITVLLASLVTNIATLLENFSAGNLLNGKLFDGMENSFSEAMGAGAEEFMKTVDRFRTPTLGPEGVENAKVVQQVNNYDVTMNNAFKEVLQPDRIAFTIQDQLEKASQNRRSTRSIKTAAQQAGTI
jgi:hypothetical protein